MDKNPAPFVNQWTKGKFNFRASFYTGRDPNSGDLNSSILEDIYQGIRKEFGDQKAKNFARFVATLGDLSASAFIQAFENFWWDDLEYMKVIQGEGTGRQLTGSSEQEMRCEGIAVITSALGGGFMDIEAVERVSNGLKAQFLRDHLEEVEDLLNTSFSSRRFSPIEEWWY